MASLCILAALLLTSCPGTGEISRMDEPTYGGSGSSSSSVSSSSSGSNGTYTANFSFDEFMRLTDSGDTDALALSADDLGVLAGGTVTLSITGGVEDYEETATTEDDGKVYFFVPRQAVGSEITVSLVVKSVAGMKICWGKKTQVVKAGCQFGIALFGGVPEDFVFVAGGTFTSASSTLATAGSQTIADFYICEHEVTQGEYEKYCSYAAASPSATYGIGPDYPVYYVSWYDALVYCNKRSMAEGLTPCYTIGGSTNPADWGTSNLT